jgi:hypothetical protein
VALLSADEIITAAVRRTRSRSIANTPGIVNIWFNGNNEFSLTVARALPKLGAKKDIIYLRLV